MIALLLEALLSLLGPAAMVLLARAAAHGALDSSRGAGAVVRDPALAAEQADQALLLYVAGVAVLLLGRALSVWRGKGNIAAPLLVPAVATALGLHVAVQMGYGDPVHYAGFPGRDAARDALLAGALGGALLGQPWLDPIGLVRQTQRLLLGGLLLTFAALLVAGGGPSGSDQKLALFGVQPLELVKLGFVLWLADFLGRRAPKLRWQREGSAWLRWPRPRILLPAAGAFVATLLGLLLVRDMGPMTVIGAVFLWMLYAVTRSQGWLIAALAALLIVVRAAIARPRLLGETFAERTGMYLDPWTNGLPVHQEVAEAAWSMASGGLGGQGPGRSLALLRWGHNDLVIAQLAEDLGFFGVLGWLSLLLAITLSCAWVAMNARTPERQLAASGLGMLLVLQTAVIFSGVTGLLPLTGIVAPFLAKGGSSLIVFTLAAALVAKIAESGQRRAEEEVLTELRWSSLEGAVITALLATGATAVAWQRTQAAETTSRGVLIQLGDGSFRHMHDPRVTEVARALPRGDLRDRDGEGLAVQGPAGRTWPLGDALGTLLGPASGTSVHRASWMLERRLEERLRGWPERPTPFVVWYVDEGGEHRVILAGEGAAREEAEARAEGLPLLRAELPNADLSAFAALVHLSPAERAAKIQALVDDVASRTVQLSLDAELQRKVSAALKGAAKRGEAAAAVVIDVDSGEVLARAQWPDVDPATVDWGTSDKRLTGVYGALPDKTGLRGVLQSGSVFKLYTALTAARAGELSATEGGPDHSCSQKDAQGPLFTRKGWPQPIHDAHGDPMHGTIDVVRGLEVSCNVYFGQLGLDLGAARMAELAGLGVEVAWGGPLRPGDDGSRQLASTAFGQGAAALHPLAAARLTAAVASGGVYRRCPATMEDDAPCVETRLFDSPARVTPILQGMRLVMTSGTGRRLTAPAGVRVYGKTGTADADLTRDERSSGVRSTEPHSWFVAIGEPDVGQPSQPQRAGRIAVAVVVPRGGAGASAAGPAAMDILAAVRDTGFLEPQR